MAVLLNIDTATRYGAVALSCNGAIVSEAENHSQKEHAAFLHPAVRKVLAESNTPLTAIDAVAVTLGPGSYTGLRVALSAAKGLCFAAQKPLVAVNTLQAIALAASGTEPLPPTGKPVLYVPMIDARRMEVFMAIYDEHNNLHTAPAAAIADQTFLADMRATAHLVFAGDGSNKLKQVIREDDSHYSNAAHSIQQVVQIAEERYGKGLLEDIAYCEPFYLKPFFTTASVKK